MGLRTFAARAFAARSLAALTDLPQLLRPPVYPAPPTGGVVIDGVDVSTWGITVTGQLQGWRDAPSFALPTRQMPGALATAVTGRRVVLPRALSFAAVIEGDTAEEVEERWSAFLYHATAEVPRRLTLADRAGRHYLGYFNAAASTPPGVRVLSSRVHEIRVAFDCPNPYAFADAVTVVPFAAATPMPLGDAPVQPLLRLAGPAAIVYRSSAGVERSRMVVGAFDASTPFELDCATGAKNKPADVTGPFVRLDPRDGTRGGPYPTLSASPAVACTAVYHLAYLTI